MTQQAGTGTGKQARSWFSLGRTGVQVGVSIVCAAALAYLPGLELGRAQDQPKVPPALLPTFPNIAVPIPNMAAPPGYNLLTAQEAAAQPELLRPPQKQPPETLPEPTPLPGFGPYQTRLSRLPGVPGPLGTTPVPSKKELAEYNRFVQEFVDPKNTLDLVQGRARLIILKEAPKRLQIADDATAGYNLLGAKEITMLGKKVGTTVFNMWFVDAENKNKEKVLSYLVRVLPDPEAKERLETVYKALQDEINRMFPNSVIYLRLVGDKLVVSGEAHDIRDATQILNIVKANAPRGKDDEAPKIPVGAQPTLRPGDPGMLGGTPGIEDFKLAGGPNVINLIRIPGEQQVMLRVTVAEVNRTAARSIGMNFSIMNKAGIVVFQNNTGNIAGGATATGGFGSNNVTGLGGNLAGLSLANLPATLDNGQISLAINALRNLSYARSLAEPNLVALNGQTANFQAGGEFPVPVVTGFTAAGLQGVSFVPYGVQLSFTPFITDKDRVRLNVAATVSTRDNSSSTTIGNTLVPGLNTRNFQTTVELREGQTLAVAGLIQNNLGTIASRIPFIGDLPILNHLTGFDQTSAGEQELVILITPELVHPMDPKEVPLLPGADLFEPGDIEFYLLGRLESRRAYDYRSPVMTNVARMRRYHRCEQLYILGPHGYQPPHAPE